MGNLIFTHQADAGEGTPALAYSRYCGGSHFRRGSVVKLYLQWEQQSLHFLYLQALKVSCFHQASDHPRTRVVQATAYSWNTDSCTSVYVGKVWDPPHRNMKDCDQHAMSQITRCRCVGSHGPVNWRRTDTLRMNLVFVAAEVPSSVGWSTFP